MLNTASDALTGFATSSIGFKKAIINGLSAYGIISYIDVEAAPDAITEFALGIAYTKNMGDLTFNVNPELVTDDAGVVGAPPRGGKNTIFVKSSAAFSVNKSTSLVAEVILNNNRVVERVVNLGARLQPKKNITLDFIIYSDAGTNATVKGIPGYVIAHILF